jgi:uncharacterized membrane protein YdbT with pleckstrin-like domain
VPTVFEASQPKKTQAKQGLSTQPAMSPLTCFALNPTGVRFETQDENEVVELFLRQHIIVNLPWVLGAILLSMIPTVFAPLLLSSLGLISHIPVSYGIVGTIFWYVMVFGFILAKFLGWFFNIYIVTNERVIDIDFYYLLYKKFSQAELNKIQDTSFETGGIVATFFNFGNVKVQTAGESPNLEFDKVPYPDQVVETIRRLTEQDEEKKP